MTACMLPMAAYWLSIQVQCICGQLVVCLRDTRCVAVKLVLRPLLINYSQHMKALGFVRDESTVSKCTQKCLYKILNYRQRMHIAATTSAKHLLVNIFQN